MVPDLPERPGPKTTAIEGRRMAKTIELFISETKRQPWGWETLIAHTPQYTGKVLLYRAGMAGGLQYHVEKDETFLLHEGQGWIDYDGGDGKLTRRRMSAGESYHIPPGAVHRFEAFTDCIVFEASTPHFE